MLWQALAAVPAVALDCAQTGEATRADVSAPGRYCGQGNSDAQICSTFVQETQKARKGTMPHERGPMPVLPSEFLSPWFADPKIRFCRSLASHLTLVNRSPAWLRIPT